jgi:hypothetical protein
VEVESSGTGGTSILSSETWETINVAIDLPSEIAEELRKRAKAAKMTPEHLLSLWIARMARESQAIRSKP